MSAILEGRGYQVTLLNSSKNADVSTFQGQRYQITLMSAILEGRGYQVTLLDSSKNAYVSNFQG
jgi:CheY-like chemotaxis protein